LTEHAFAGRLLHGLPKAGEQQPKAAKGGISDDYIITDVFKKLK
jgi:hypothetical protein